MSKKSGGPPTHHVVPRQDSWAVERGGASRASGVFDTKAEAVGRAREISRNAGTELRIHNRNGAIGSSDSHGNDPFPPEG